MIKKTKNSEHHIHIAKSVGVIAFGVILFMGMINMILLNNFSGLQTSVINIGQTEYYFPQIGLNTDGRNGRIDLTPNKGAYYLWSDDITDAILHDETTWLHNYAMGWSPTGSGTLEACDWDASCQKLKVTEPIRIKYSMYDPTDPNYYVDGDIHGAKDWTKFNIDGSFVYPGGKKDTGVSLSLNLTCSLSDTPSLRVVYSDVDFDEDIHGDIPGNTLDLYNLGPDGDEASTLNRLDRKDVNPGTHTFDLAADQIATGDILEVWGRGYVPYHDKIGDPYVTKVVWGTEQIVFNDPCASYYLRSNASSAEVDEPITFTADAPSSSNGETVVFSFKNTDTNETTTDNAIIGLDAGDGYSASLTKSFDTAGSYRMTAEIPDMYNSPAYVNMSVLFDIEASPNTPPSTDVTVNYEACTISVDYNGDPDWDQATHTQASQLFYLNIGEASTETQADINMKYFGFYPSTPQVWTSSPSKTGFTTDIPQFFMDLEPTKPASTSLPDWYWDSGFRFDLIYADFIPGTSNVDMGAENSFLWKAKRNQFGDPANNNLCPQQTGAVDLSVDLSASSENACIGEDVTLTGAVTGGTAPYTCKWDFENDGTVDETNAAVSGTCETTHAYDANATTKLTVEDSTGGAINSAEVTIAIAVTDCSDLFEVDMNPNTDQAVRRGQSLTLRPLVAGGTTPYECTWNFGDSTSEVTNDCSSNVTHAYNTVGTFATSLKATDSAGHEGNKAISVTVTETPAPMTVDMNPNTNQAVNTGASITFQPIVRNGVTPYRCTWSFGDGTGSTVNNCTTNVSHTFNKAGTFTTQLSARDSASGSGSKSIRVMVSNAATLSVEMSPGTQQNIKVGESITYTATTTGGTSPINCSWRFNDGGGIVPMPKEDSKTFPKPITKPCNQSVTHQYTTAGSFNAVVVARDSSVPQLTANDKVNVVVGESDFSCSFIPNDDTTLENTSESLWVKAFPENGTGPYTCDWDFNGDGTYGDNETNHDCESPYEYFYDTPGVYDPVTVRCNDTATGDTAISDNSIKVTVNEDDTCIDDQYEPNDTHAQATMVTTGSYDARMCPKLDPDTHPNNADKDWYTAWGAANGTLRFDVHFTNADGDINLYLFNGDDFTTPVQTALTSTDNEVITYTPPTDGQYYLKVNLYRGGVINPGGTDYTMNVTAGCESLVDESTSTMTVNPAEVPADGTTASTVTVTLKDTAGDPVASEPVSLQATSSLVDGIYVIDPISGTSDANGLFTADVTASANQILTMKAISTCRELDASPTITFETEQYTCTLDAVPGTISGDGVDSSEISVTVNDQHGPAQGISVDLEADPDTYVTLTQPATSTDANGQTSGSMTATEAGSVAINAFVDGTQCNTAGDTTVTVIGADQGSLRVLVPLQGRDTDPTNDTADHAYPITLSLYDNTGTSVFATDSVQAWTRGSDGLFPDPNDPGATAINAPGATAINAVMNDLDVTLNPYKLVVSSKAHLEYCAPITVTQGEITTHHVKYSNQEPHLLGGNINQTDSGPEAINVNDVTMFLDPDTSEWGNWVDDYDEYDFPIANDPTFIYDLNGNGQVGAEDFSILLNSLGSDGCDSIHAITPPGGEATSDAALPAGSIPMALCTEQKA